MDDEEAVVRRWLLRRARVVRHLRRARGGEPAGPVSDPARLPALAALWLSNPAIRRWRRRAR